LVGLNSNNITLKFCVESGNFVEEDHSIKSITIRNKKFANMFVNTNSVKLEHERLFESHQERVQRAIIMEYYNPGYLDDVLLPFIEWNREGDLKRAETSLYKTKLLYQNDKILKKAEKQYSDTKFIYSQDWASHFTAIRTIIAEVKHNEQQNEVAPKP